MEKTEKRGRPKSIDVGESPRKYSQEYTNKKSGIKEIWHYDLDEFPNGPIKVELEYPEGYTSFEEDQEKLSKTARMYFNPASNSYVAYGRASSLGLLKEHKEELKLSKTTSKPDKVKLDNNEDLPKTQRTYINPNNGKIIGYTRARMLKLID